MRLGLTKLEHGRGAKVFPRQAEIWEGIPWWCRVRINENEFIAEEAQIRGFFEGISDGQGA
jgi:hypothetical protein